MINVLICFLVPFIIIFLLAGALDNPLTRDELKGFGWFYFTLFVVLMVMFAPCLKRDVVFFSNDGPYGAQVYKCRLFGRTIDER